jgi:hypothetical protein
LQAGRLKERAKPDNGLRSYSPESPPGGRDFIRFLPPAPEPVEKKPGALGEKEPPHEKADIQGRNDVRRNHSAGIYLGHSRKRTVNVQALEYSHNLTRSSLQPGFYRSSSWRAVRPKRERQPEPTPLIQVAVLFYHPSNKLFLSPVTPEKLLRQI